MKQEVVQLFIGAQGSGKSVQDYVKSIKLVKDRPGDPNEADDFLSAFNAGFKGEK